jgi:hypothetical protein
MSSQQKSLLIDSPTQLEGVASLAGAKRSLADDATESNGIVVTNDVIANKFAVV